MYNNWIIVFLFYSAMTGLVYSKSEKDTIARNSFYLELGGNSIAYSVNYDRLVGDYFSIRFGTMYFPEIKVHRKTASGGISLFSMLNFLVGNENHKLESGLGPLFITKPDFSFNEFGYAITGTLGYRYQQRTGGFLFRIGFTPYYDLRTDFFVPMGGLSFGYSL